MPEKLFPEIVIAIYVHEHFNLIIMLSLVSIEIDHVISETML